MIRGNNKDQCRCRDCGRWISYHDITKTFDGCNYCEGYDE
jgi:ribosomal protein L37E